MRNATGIAFLLLLAGCASTPTTWTEADNQTYINFRAERLARARALATEGDQALTGSPERALERYAQALQALGLRGRLGLDGKAVPEGYQVTTVVPDLPAARAGLRPGDIVVRMRGAPVPEMSLAQRDIAMQREPGGNLPLQVRRAGAAPFQVTVVTRHADWQPNVKSNEEAETIVALRFKAARAASRARTLPPIPAAAREAAARAQSQARTAKTREQLDEADSEFKVASLLAPWWSDLYINHALFQEATEDAIGARQSLALYLESRPHAPDRAAVSQKQAALAGKAEEQKRLMAWEGYWARVENGRRQTSGHFLERKGRILTAKGDDGFEYLRATIVDEYTAQAINRFQPTFKHCFSGRYHDVAGTFRLSRDKTTLTETMNNPVMTSSCQVVRHDVQTKMYMR